MQLGFLFTWLSALIGAGLGWLWPFVGLMVYYMFAILRPPFLWFWVFDPATAPRFSFYIAISTLAGWAFRGFGDWSKLRGMRLAAFGLILYLGAGTFAAYFNAPLKHLAWDSLQNQFKIGIMALLTFTIVRDARSIRIFAWVVVGALGYMAFVLNEWYMINPRYLHNHGFGAIDNNGVGMICVMTVPLAFFMGVYDRRLWVRLICFAIAVCAVHVVLFSFSRGSQVGLCLVGGMIFVFALLALPRKLLTLTLTAVFVFITLKLAGDQVRERFMSIFAEDLDTSAQSRFDTWNAGYHIMMDHPLGVGPRNSGFYMDEFGFYKGKAIHNLYLQTGADYGIFGLLGLMLFYFSAFFQCFFMTFRSAARQLIWPFYIGVGVCISLGGFLTCSVFIGMESVEVGFIISLLGLTAVAFVNRVIAAGPLGDLNAIPELAQVPKPDQETPVLPAPEHEPDHLPGWAPA